MSRLLFCLFIVLAARWLWRVSRKTSLTQHETRYRQPMAHADVPPEKIVRCMICGIYIPRSQAKNIARETFCCRAHPTPSNPSAAQE